MNKWIRKFSMCSLAFMILFMSSVMTATTAHAGTVLTFGDESASELKLNVQEKSMVTGSTFNLRVYNLTENQKVIYRSSDMTVADVTKKGNITALSVGAATITVTVKDTITGSSTILTCDIKVGPPATSIILTQDNLVLEVDQKVSLKTIIKPHNTAEVAVFYSLNPEIATVSATGKVTAKAAGEVTIYAAIASGDFSKCIITVVEIPEEIVEPVEETTVESAVVESSATQTTENIKSTTN